MPREYLDVDIPLNVKEKGILGKTTYTQAVEFLRDEANHLIRTAVERYRADGWVPEGSIDVLRIWKDGRLKYKNHWLRGNMTMISARITFHRDTKDPSNM